MLDKECRTVHRCGTLVLGVFLEKDKLLPLFSVITHYDTHTHAHALIGGVRTHTHTCTFSIGKICKWRKEKKQQKKEEECTDAVRKVKRCK